MKITEKTVELILLLLIVITATCAYRFGYMEYKEKTEKVEKENQVLETEVANLEQRVANKLNLIVANEKADAMIDRLLEPYGKGTTTEKTIARVVELQEKTGVEIPSISFNDATVIYASSVRNEAGDPMESISQANLAFSYGTSYEGLKEVMDFIENYKERMSVTTISASRSGENGYLTGNISLVMYNAIDERHKYEDPDIKGIAIGKDNIFE